jgi:uncharacterized membrane protein (DUF373 family)
MTRDAAGDGLPAATRLVGSGIQVAETVLYGLLTVLLFAGALILLVDAIHALATETGNGVSTAIEQMLEALLLVFILVELSSAVRSTVEERRLVAEPFLLVGIIASIKEVVAVAAFAQPDQEVDEAMLQVGVLGGVILVLAFASYLLRRKEREPEE